MKKQTIKLNESQLRNIIKNVLQESWPETANRWSSFDSYSDAYDISGLPTPDNIDDEKKQAWRQLKKEFEDEFGQGTFEKAREIANKFSRWGINPSNFLFKRFTSEPVKAWNGWNMDRKNSPYARSKFPGVSDDEWRKLEDEWRKEEEELESNWKNAEYERAVQSAMDAMDQGEALNETIKLNESQLRNIIKESIKKVLKEKMEQ